MELNSKRKREKYKELVDRLKRSYDDVVYANISMGACGLIAKDSKKFLDKTKDSRDRNSIFN